MSLVDPVCELYIYMGRHQMLTQLFPAPGEGLACEFTHIVPTYPAFSDAGTAIWYAGI